MFGRIKDLIDQCNFRAKTAYDWLSMQRIVLIICIQIAHVMSVSSLHITDDFWLY